ncbi:MAG: HAD family phosphatase [Phycisphaerales bacterium]
MVRKAVIFDFDGVLVDSERAHMWSILRAIEPEGWSADPEAMFQEFVGTSDRYCFGVLGERHGVSMTEELHATLVARKLERFLDAVGDGRVTAQEGGFELLRSAAERVPVVVCTGSRRATVLPVLEKHGVLDALVGVVAADDVGKTKPDPEAYRAACGVAGHDPSDCVAIEDTEHGIASGVGAGLRVIAVRHTYQDERLSGAHEVVDRIGEITVEDLLGR